MKKTLIIAALIVLAANLRAEDKPVQLSLTPDVALYPKTTVVHGLTLSVWGENEQHGLALGFVNGSVGDSLGLSLGLVNYADSYTGVQLGVVNVSKESFTGWQSGAVNVAQDAGGLQLGVVNYAENLDGVQIGLLNVAKNNGWFDEFPHKLATGFPIVNWSF